MHRLSMLHGGYRGSRKEYQEVVDFWKPYGVRPKRYWYQLFSDGRGKFDPRYIPDTMWFSRIIPYFNNYLLGQAYADKCAYDLLFPHLLRPRTIVKNSCGRYYGGSQNTISREEAIELCLREKSFIVKRAMSSSGGMSIKVFDEGEISRDTVEKIFSDYGMNFVIQELVRQHADLAALNPSSLNTLRVMTLYFQGEVHVLSAQLRIGGNGARVDNYSSGGFACNVNEDGRLSERAVSKAQGWATVHPNGYAFSDVVVPCFGKVIETIKREHARLSHLNLIGWDFAVSESGEPVFIEINMVPGQNQNGSGPTFGDLTEEVLKDVFITKSLKDAFN